MISPSNTAPSLTNPDKPDYGGPFYFRTAYNDNVQGAAVAKYACEVLKVKTAATIHDGSPYAEQLQQVFVDQFKALCNGTTTSQQAINVGDTDFHSVLTTIAASNNGAAPDMLFFPIFSPEGPLVAKQTADVSGLANMILFGADGLKDGGFIAAAGPFAQTHGGPMYFSGPDLNFGTAYTDVFLPKYYALSGTTTPLAPYHAQAYDGANILMDAIAAVAVREVDHEEHAVDERVSQGDERIDAALGDAEDDQVAPLVPAEQALRQRRPGARGHADDDTDAKRQEDDVDQRQATGSSHSAPPPNSGWGGSQSG